MTMQLIQISEATAARRRVMFRLVDATDGFTPELTVDLTTAADVQISKNGGAFASRLGSAPTEIGAGQYYYELTAAECDTEGVLTVKVVDVTSRPYIALCQVVPWDPYAGDWGTAAALVNIQADTDDLQLATPPLNTVGPLSLGSLAANGSSAAISALQAYSTAVTVTGTFGGGSAQVQTCEDVTATVPVWSSSGSALTANGSVTVADPHAGIRVTLTGATSPALVITALMREPV